MKKNIICLLSAAALLCLCACGEKSQPTPTSTTAPVIESPQAEGGYFQENPDAQPGPVTYSGKTYVYTAEIHKPGADNVLPGDSALLSCQDAALAQAECYLYSSEKYPDGVLLKYSQQSYLLFTLQASPTPQTAPPAPAAPVGGSSGADSAAAVSVTKSPTDESVTAGGTARFSAHADNATSIYWIFSPPDGSNVFSASELQYLFQTLEIEELEGDVVELRGVPLEMDGWKLRARFSSGISYADSDSATLSVSP